jgi:hypothetical protein
MTGIEEWLLRVAKADVKGVEFRAPGISTRDAQHVRTQILGGAIFCRFSAQEREIILENILGFKGIIPSLTKLFQDINFLGLCFNGLKYLVTPTPKQSIFSALKNSYEDKRESQQVAVAESIFRSASDTECMIVGYLVLVVFIMRNFRDLPKANAPLTKTLREKPRAKTDDEVLQRLASLAATQGFSSLEIKRLKGNPEPLLNTHPQRSIPISTTGIGETMKQRSGTPRAKTFEHDRKYLFLPSLLEERDETGEGITSYFVLKCWFTAFFDPLRYKRALENRLKSCLQLSDEGTVDMGDSNPTANQQEGTNIEQETSQQTQNQQDINMSEQETFQQTQNQQDINMSEQEAPQQTLEIMCGDHSEVLEEDSVFGNYLICQVSK